MTQRPQKYLSAYVVPFGAVFHGLLRRRLFGVLLARNTIPRPIPANSIARPIARLTTIDVMGTAPLQIVHFVPFRTLCTKSGQMRPNSCGNICGQDIPSGLATRKAVDTRNCVTTKILVDHETGNYIPGSAERFIIPEFDGGAGKLLLSC